MKERQRIAWTGQFRLVSSDPGDLYDSSNAELLQQDSSSLPLSFHT